MFSSFRVIGFIRLTVLAPLIIITASGCTLSPFLGSLDSPPTAERETDAVIKGIRAYEEGRYDDAVPLFLKVIESYPGSSMLMDAQWYLAKSYIAAGKTELAHRELNLFLKNYSGSPYEKEARLFLNQPKADSETVFAVVLSQEATASLKDLLRLNPLGVNTVILEISDEQLKKNALSPSGPPAHDSLYEWIRSLRKAKFRVLIKIPLRTMRWAILRRPNWRDQKYDSHKKTFKTTEALDLFHPEVRKMVLTLCGNIAKYPIDGIYVDQMAYGMEEGYSPLALAHYQHLFSEKLQVEKVFKKEKSASKTGSRHPHSPQFWRFIGLKSRYLAGLLGEIGATVRSVDPQMEFGIGIPDVLLVDPVSGLAQYSLDYLELKEAQMHFYVITSIASAPDRLYEALLKYGKTEKVWFQSPRGPVPYLHRMPIQGIVVPYP